MFPRKSLALWQIAAQGPALGEIGFAPKTGLRDDHRVSSDVDLPARWQDCYPFPSPWPGPARVRSFFLPADARQAATCTKNGFLGFESAVIPVESPAITTNHRGSSECGNRSYSSLCLLFPWPVAWTTRRRAGLPGPQLALFWQGQPKTTPLRVPSSVVLPGRPLARCRRRNARPATDLTAAQAASTLSTASRGASPAGRLSFTLPAFLAASVRPALRRAPCSRKS
jgi:hypothetical protein